MLELRSVESYVHRLYCCSNETILLWVWGKGHLQTKLHCLYSEGGKQPEGWPQILKRSSEPSTSSEPIDKSRQVHPLQRPLHIRISEYNKLRKTLFEDSSPKNKKKLRSRNRIKLFWKNIKNLKSAVISSIFRGEIDKRPHTLLEIFGQQYTALLDSGATTSVIGGSLVETASKSSLFKKLFGNVNTADGHKQSVLGSIKLKIAFNNRNKPFVFLLVPSITDDVICGIDFFDAFGLDVCASPQINALTINEISDDKLDLSLSDGKKLDAAIAAFPSFEREGLGCTSLVEHKIDTGSAAPIKQRYYPVSPAIEQRLCKEIDRMLSLGVIEEAENSAWSSPVVLVTKPEKDRLCLDSRRLNSVTLKDAYPIPNIDGLISRLPPVYCISKIDLKDAFWQIPLDPESRPKTAFTVPNRPLYQYTRMPFGLCNAPQALCHLMDKTITYTVHTLSKLVKVLRSFQS